MLTPEQIYGRSAFCCSYHTSLSYEKTERLVESQIGELAAQSVTRLSDGSVLFRLPKGFDLRIWRLPNDWTGVQYLSTTIPISCEAMYRVLRTALQLANKDVVVLRGDFAGSTPAIELVAALSLGFGLVAGVKLYEAIAE